MSLVVSGTATAWVYDLVEHRLILRRPDDEREVTLSRPQHLLLAYMAERNRAAGDRAVLCGREELIAAVWGEEANRGPSDLTYLIHQLRGRLDGERGVPALIVNERGRGYRLLADALHGVDRSELPLATMRQPDRPRSSRRRLLLGGLGVAALAVVTGYVWSGGLKRPVEPILREGSRGQDVLALQRDLMELGYNPVYLDGQFGPLTAAAVRAFQVDHGVVVDGEVGPETRAALKRAVELHRATPASP